MFTEACHQGHEVNIKVNQFFIWREEIITVYKYTKFDIGSIYCMLKTKLNATTESKLLTG